MLITGDVNGEIDVYRLNRKLKYIQAKRSMWTPVIKKTKLSNCSIQTDTQQSQHQPATRTKKAKNPPKETPSPKTTNKKALKRRTIKRVPLRHRPNIVMAKMLPNIDTLIQLSTIDDYPCYNSIYMKWVRCFVTVFIIKLYIASIVSIVSIPSYNLYLSYVLSMNHQL